jgi:GH24 family phage-related lysozyme (muramidase)
MKKSTKNAIVVLIVFCLCMIILIQKKAAEMPCPQQISPVISLDYSDYDIALQKIKEFEGFAPKPYNCPAGQKTIGYGSYFKSWGHNSITERQADSLLRVSFDKHIRLAYRQTKLEGRQLLAVAMLMMNLKFTSWQKSTLRQVVTSDDRERITAAWMSLCNAGGKKLKGLEKRRHWELQFFMSNK